MTAPALNATVRPSLSVPVPRISPVFSSTTSRPAQAAVVRVLPSVATIMPHQPAVAERTAPRKNANIVRTPSVFVVWSWTVKSTRRMRPRKRTNLARDLYSSYRKALAPSLTIAPYLSTTGRPTPAPVGNASSDE